MNRTAQTSMLLPQRMDIRRALSTTPPVPDFVLPGLPVGTVGALVAPGATGKTLLLLQISVALAIGAPVLGGGMFSADGHVSTQPGKVVLVVAEETAALMHARLHAALGELLSRVRTDLLSEPDKRLDELLAENLHIYPLAGRYRMLIDRGDAAGDGLEALDRLSDGARLVALDPLRQFHSGEENDPWVMTKLVQDLQMMACTRTAAVLLAHHTNKWSTTSGQGDRAGASRGSGGFTDAVRWQMNVSTLDEDLAAAHGVDLREVRHHVRLDLAKANYLPPQAPVVLRRGPGGAFSVVTASRPRTTSRARVANGGRT
jgi:RecA-family ATPase